MWTRIEKNNYKYETEMTRLDSNFKFKHNINVIKSIEFIHPEFPCSFMIMLYSSPYDQKTRFIFSYKQALDYKENAEWLLWNKYIGSKDNFQPIYHVKELDSGAEHIEMNKGLDCSTFEKELFLGMFLVHYNLEGSDIDFELHKLSGLRKKDTAVFIKIIECLNAGGIQEAIKKAIQFQDDDYYHPIWELACLLHQKYALNAELTSKDDWNILYHLYAAINEKNPHLVEAQSNMHNMINSMPLRIDDSLFQEKFTTGLLGKVSQNEIDLQYHKLCGFLELNPAIQNVGLNIETLCNIAVKMREMNKMIQSLQKENVELLSNKSSVEMNNSSQKRKYSPRMNFSESTNNDEENLSLSSPGFGK